MRLNSERNLFQRREDASSFKKEKIMFSSGKKFDDKQFSNYMAFGSSRQNTLGGFNQFTNNKSSNLFSNSKVSNNLFSNHFGFLGNNENNMNNTFNEGLLFQNSLKSREQVQPKSEQILKILMMKYKCTLTLLPSKEVNFNDYTNIPSELANVKCHVWVEKYKRFVVKVLIEDFIHEHDNNLININKLLEATGLQLVGSIPDEEPDSLNDFLYNKFNDPNAFNKDKNFQDEQSNAKINIFYGDTSRILKIIYFLDSKLRNFKVNSNQNINFEKNLQNVPQFKSNDDYLANLIKQNNPFLKKKEVTDYRDTINRSKIQLEQNFINLKHLLLHRVVLNEKLFPSKFMKAQTEKHVHIIIEYCVSRLKELKSNLGFYKNNGGGKFHSTNWNSFFPTDSQIIANLSIFYIEEVYQGSYLKKNFLFTYPFAPSKI